ncbi:hypothetical protein [Streptomyces sp. NPDC048639]|uniref:hypothetical protein n=1 Tax=Streptomyces sp. NPDC048639 TaxID=3365581 RepID=UPI0037168793
MTLTADTVTAERLEELLADRSIPAVHRTLWLLLWEGELPVLELLSLDVRDVEFDTFGERAAELLRELIGDRESGPVFAVGERSLTWEEAVQAAHDQGHGIHAFRTGGKRSRRAR